MAEQATDAAARHPPRAGRADRAGAQAAGSAASGWPAWPCGWPSLTPLQVLIPEQLQDIRPQQQDPRARPRLGLRRGRPRCSPRRSLARCPTGPRTPQRRPAARQAAPLDAGDGAARRHLPGADRRPAHGARHRRPVGAVQRVPERRVRQPERGDPRPRPGEPAGHGGRLGRHAAGARPGGRHRPGRLRVPRQRWSAAIWRSRSRWCCSRCRSCSARPTTRWSPSTGSRSRRARCSASYWIGPRRTRISPGPGSPGSWPRSRSGWARCTCCTSCATRSHYKHPAQGLFILIVIYTGCVVDHRDRRRRDLRPDRQAEDDRDGLRRADGRRRAAADVRRDLAGRRGRRRAVRRRLRRLPGRRPGADHPGAARGAEDRAKDLGIINIAIVGPAAVGGAIAGAAGQRRRLPDPVRQPPRSSPRSASMLVWRIKSVPSASGAPRCPRSLPAPRGPERAAADAGDLPALRDQVAGRVPDLGLLVEPAAADMPATWPRPAAAQVPAPPACAWSARPWGPSRSRRARTPPAAARPPRGRAVSASGSRSSRRPKYPRISGRPVGSPCRQPITAGSNSILIWPA